MEWEIKTTTSTSLNTVIYETTISLTKLAPVVLLLFAASLPLLRLSPTAAMADAIPFHHPVITWCSDEFVLVFLISIIIGSSLSEEESTFWEDQKIFFKFNAKQNKK